MRHTASRGARRVRRTSIGTLETSETGLGVVFLVTLAVSLGLASLKVGHGLAFKRVWAWQGAIMIFSVAAVTTVVMSLVGISIIETFVLFVMCTASLRTLFRAEVRVELGGAIPSRGSAELGSAA